VNCALAFSSANILLICITGGYEFAIGPLQVTAYHLKNPLILWCAVAATRAWYTWRNRTLQGSPRFEPLDLGERPTPSTNGRIGSRDAAFVFLVFSLSRAIIFSAMGMSSGYVTEAAYPSKWQINSVLLRPLFRWDAGWYMSIAQHGYAYNGDPTREHNIVFLPLYPVTCRVCHQLTGLSIPLCAVLLSNLAFLAGLHALYRLVARELRPEVAQLTILLLAFFPTSLFFSSMYTESFFLLFSVLAYTAFRRQHFIQGGLWAGLASATRIPGILLGIPLLFEGLPYLWDRRQCWQVVLASVLVVSGIAAYMAYLWVTFGDPIANFHVQQQSGWERAFALPFASIKWGLKQTCSGQFSPFPFDAWLSLLFIVLICALPFYLPKSYALYASLAIAMPLFTKAGIWSMTRYLSVVFPALMMLGIIGGRWNWVAWVVLTAFAVTMVHFAMYFAQWHWVG
jgi:mannosyltransferase PIG-V